MILVLNTGSSSLKFRLYADTPNDLELVMRGAVTDLGPHARWQIDIRGHKTHGADSPLADHATATRWILDRMRDEKITAIGHRVVHGGDVFQTPVLLTDTVLDQLEALSSIAPLHNPIALHAIRTCRDVLGTAVPMVAAFDTAFHATLPEAARTYALPAEWNEEHGIRRYGFHGLAHRYMLERYLAIRGASRTGHRVITFQLGNGCSVCALQDGRSVDTSMGYTPLEGLVMSTRSGDLDPGILLRLLAEGSTVSEIEQGLNRKAGLLGLSGKSADMRELLALAERGDAGARLAIDTFTHRARKYLGAYTAVLGGVDAVLFGGGIGEHTPSIRERICEGMAWCGLRLDRSANQAAIGHERRISTDDSTIAVHVLPVDEESLIARDTRALIAASH